MLQLTDIFATLGQYKITHFLIEKTMGNKIFILWHPMLCVLYAHI